MNYFKFIFNFSETVGSSLKVFKFCTEEVVGPEILNAFFDIGIQIFEMESSYFDVDGNNRNQMLYALDSDWNDSTEISEEAEEQNQIQLYNNLYEDDWLYITDYS